MKYFSKQRGYANAKGNDCGGWQGWLGNPQNITGI